MDFINPDTGHQDALIGAGRIATFEKIRNFFDATSPPPPPLEWNQRCCPTSTTISAS
jgi:hypothetical protein